MSKELNRQISELREPESDAELPTDNWQYYDLVKHQAEPTNWTGSEEASAVLLEEMPEPMVWEEFAAENGKARVWGAEAEQGDEKRQYFPCAFDADRKVAVAKAWLVWKKSIVEAAQ